ncbi:hypothetical protein [Bacillus subtilis]|uniref:hypothetical protein n=1 Tax=Bacillus subtilis TaxID=1423 RepID=UPI0021D8DBA4|nr:hypothetical protein [Bacillus subtilis]
MMKLQQVTYETAIEIVHERKPIGKFFAMKQTIYGPIWTGIDNSSGNAWIQDFRKEEKCKEWLADKQLTVA